MNTYIHIPFCRQKCSYCKFALTPVFNDYKKQKYLKFLSQEIQVKLQQFNNPNIETIYFGGGTPSILTPNEIQHILSLFPKNVSEISFEANPEDISEVYLKNLFELGINRISIGIQTLNPQTLKEIGRSPAEHIFSALESLKKFEVGKVILFGNTKISINTDLILELPYNKKGEIYNNIKILHENFPFITHTSVYILEKGLYPEYWQEKSLNDTEIMEEFLQICEYFQKKGWNHYEFSNFAQPGYECKHNQGYWDHTETLGFGLSASEFVKINEKYTRNTNASSFSGYYQGKKFSETLDNEQIEIEKFLFGIRTNGYFYNSKIPIIDTKICEKFLQEGLLEGNTSHFSLSKKGFALIDYITESLIK